MRCYPPRSGVQICEIIGVNFGQAFENLSARH
jgi:hypothetical protein